MTFDVDTSQWTQSVTIFDTKINFFVCTMKRCERCQSVVTCKDQFPQDFITSIIIVRWNENDAINLYRCEVVIPTLRKSDENLYSLPKSGSLKGQNYDYSKSKSIFPEHKHWSLGSTLESIGARSNRADKMNWNRPAVVYFVRDMVFGRS